MKILLSLMRLWMNKGDDVLTMSLINLPEIYKIVRLIIGAMACANVTLSNFTNEFLQQYNVMNLNLFSISLLLLAIWFLITKRY